MFLKCACPVLTTAEPWSEPASADTYLSRVIFMSNPNIGLSYRFAWLTLDLCQKDAFNPLISLGFLVKTMMNLACRYNFLHAVVSSLMKTSKTTTKLYLILYENMYFKFSC